MLIHVGGRYTHYKHPEQPYEVKGLVVLEATDEVAVRYAVVGNPAVEFVRPLSSWLEAVDQVGKTVLRFTPLP